MKLRKFVPAMLVLAAAPFAHAAVTITSPADYATVEAHSNDMVAYLNNSANRSWQTYASSTVGSTQRLAWKTMSRAETPVLPLTWSGTSGNCTVKIYRVCDNTLVWTANGTGSVTFPNPEIGRNYRWEVIQSGTTQVTGHFFVKRTAPRMLNAYGGIGNARDLGGWTAASGKVVKQGLLFRTEEWDYCTDGYYDSGCCPKPYWRDTLGIKLDVDLRCTNAVINGYLPSKQAGSGLTKSPIDLAKIPRFTSELCPGAGPAPADAGIDAAYTVSSDVKVDGSYVKHTKLEAHKAVYHIFTNVVAHVAANKPVIFHCSQGKDRTGTFAYLFNGLLGVSRDDLNLDYAVTYTWDDEYKLSKWNVDAVYTAVNLYNSSGTLAEKIASFLQQCYKDAGSTAAKATTDIAAFRAAMLENAETAAVKPGGDVTKVTVPTLSSSSATWTGNAVTKPTVASSSYYTVDYGSSDWTDAGHYTVTVTLNNTSTTQWSDGTTAPKELDFKIIVSSPNSNYMSGAPIQAGWIKGQTPPKMWWGRPKHGLATETSTRTQASLASLSAGTYSTTFAVAKTDCWPATSETVNFTVYPDTEKPTYEYEYLDFSPKDHKTPSGFDTGITFNHSTTKIEYKFRKNVNATSGCGFLTASDGEDANKYSYTLFLYSSGCLTLRQPVYKDADVATDFNADQSDHVLVTTGNSVTFDGVKKSSASVANVISEHSLWIGTGSNYSGDSRSTWYAQNQRFYYLKMWSGNGTTLIHHWVPVKTSSNAVMLYDKVTKQLMPPFVRTGSSLTLGGTATAIDDPGPTPTPGPTDYGNPDAKAATYTWKGFDGPWEYTTNWTADANASYGIPSQATYATANFPASVTAATACTLASDRSVQKALFNSPNLTLTIDNATLTVAGVIDAETTYGAYNFGNVATGNPKIVFKGANPGIYETTGDYRSNFGCIAGGASGYCTVRFEVPAANWAQAPIRTAATESKVCFWENVKLEIDATALGVPAAGVTVTVPLAASAQGVYFMADNFDTIIGRSTISVASGAAGTVAVVGNDLVLQIVKGAEPAVDPTQYGAADTVARTYTWKGFNGPWEYTTNWTASSGATYGIPHADKVLAVFPASVTASTVCTVSQSHSVSNPVFDSPNLTLRLTDATVTVAGPYLDEDTYGAYNFGMSGAGDSTLAFVGANAGLAATHWTVRCNIGSQTAGSTGACKVRFEVPATGWEASAPLRATGSDSNIRFKSDVTFDIDATAFGVPEEGVTNTVELVRCTDGVRFDGYASTEEGFAAIVARSPAVVCADGAKGMLFLDEKIEDGKYNVLKLAVTADVTTEPEPTYHDWIQTDSQGFFQTTYVPNHKTTKFEVKVMATDAVWTTVLAANGKTAGGSGYGNLVFLGFNAAGTVDWNNTCNNVNCGATVAGGAFGTVHTMTGCGNTITVDGITTTGASAAQDHLADGPLFIGAPYDTTSASIHPLKIYYVKAWEGETLVHDYRPGVTAEGVATLYDTVKQKALVPTKGGAFYCGDDALANAWTAEPALSTNIFAAGAAVTVFAGTPAHGTAAANYTAEQLAALAPGCYTYRATATAEGYAPLIKEIDFVVLKKDFDVAHTIVCYGDSITAGYGSTATTVDDRANFFDGRMKGVVLGTETLDGGLDYPYYLSGLVPADYNVISQAKSAMWTDTILAWQGGVECVSRQAATLPAGGAGVWCPTNICFTAANPYGIDGGLQAERDKYYRAYQTNYLAGVSACTLPCIEAFPTPCGKWGTMSGWFGDKHVRIYGTQTGHPAVTGKEYGTYTPDQMWARIGDADTASVTIPAGTPFVPDSARIYQDAITVIFSGTNDGTNNYETFIPMIAKAVAKIPSERYVVISSQAPSARSDKMEAAFAAAFGEHYLNLHAMMETNGLKTAVRIGAMTSAQASAAKTWFSTAALINDNLHPNSKGYRVIATFLKQKLETLGYIPATPEPAPVEPQPVYDPTAKTWTFEQDVTYGYATNAVYGATKADFKENASLVITNGANVTVSNAYLGASGNAFTVREKATLAMTAKSLSANKTWSFELDGGYLYLNGANWAFQATDVVNLTLANGGYCSAQNTSLTKGIFHFDATDSEYKFNSFEMTTAGTSICLNNSTNKSNWAFTMGTSGAQTLELAGRAPIVRSSSGALTLGANATVTLRPEPTWSASEGRIHSPAGATASKAAITLASGAKFNVDVTKLTGRLPFTFCLLSAPNTQAARSIKLPTAANVTVCGTGAENCTVEFTQDADSRHVYVTVAAKAAPYPSWIDDQDAANKQQYDTWASKYKVTDPTAVYQEAYLLNCSNTVSAIEAAKEAFKITSITIDADGNVTVAKPTAPEGGFNGKVEVRGAETVDGNYILTQEDKKARFFKAFLTYLPSNGDE